MPTWLIVLLSISSGILGLYIALNILCGWLLIVGAWRDSKTSIPQRFLESIMLIFAAYPILLMLMVAEGED